jgi:8-oxo-dGTP pyrophosphatase MutT (NUDIX family)
LPSSPDLLQEAITILSKEPPPYHIEIDSNFPEIDFEQLRKQYKIIQAAGGLVRNEKGDVLFIFRKGKWDLPKGKLDNGETFATCAKREVEEECGLEVSAVADLFSITYHVYRDRDGTMIMKDTFWYTMDASVSATLQPQAEEDITAIEWADGQRQKIMMQNTYPLIRDLVRKYHNETGKG